MSEKNLNSDDVICIACGKKIESGAIISDGLYFHCECYKRHISNIAERDKSKYFKILLHMRKLNTELIDIHLTLKTLKELDQLKDNEIVYYANLSDLVDTLRKYQSYTLKQIFKILSKS